MTDLQFKLGGSNVGPNDQTNGCNDENEATKYEYEATPRGGHFENGGESMKEEDGTVNGGGSGVFRTRGATFRNGKSNSLQESEHHRVTMDTDDCSSSLSHSQKVYVSSFEIL